LTERLVGADHAVSTFPKAQKENQAKVPEVVESQQQEFKMKKERVQVILTVSYDAALIYTRAVVLRGESPEPLFN
jgi:hypothetical protein